MINIKIIAKIMVNPKGVKIPISSSIRSSLIFSGYIKIIEYDKKVKRIISYITAYITAKKKA